MTPCVVFQVSHPYSSTDLGTDYRGALHQNSPKPQSIASPGSLHQNRQNPLSLGYPGAKFLPKQSLTVAELSLS